jgi:hypothetical protein
LERVISRDKSAAIFFLNLSFKKAINFCSQKLFWQFKLKLPLEKAENNIFGLFYE